MKQYTTPDQTAKLIELGFEKPRLLYFGNNIIGHYSYTIGELIDILPISFETVNDDTSWLEIEAGAVWSVSYSSFGFTDYDCERKELIDALYDTIIVLKEEGVI